MNTFLKINLDIYYIFTIKMIATLLPHMIISTNIYTHICNYKHIKKNVALKPSSETVVFKNKPQNTPQIKINRINPILKKTLIHMSPQNTEDSLFWCFSQIADEDCKTTNIMLKKIQYIDELTPIYTILRKQFSLVAFSSITNFLAYKQKINISTLLALCAYKQINVCVIYPNSHFICESDPGSSDYYIIRLNKNKAFSYTKIDRTELSTYTNNSILIGLDKITLKAVSAYTANQLKEYAELIGISLINCETKKPKIKQVLYENLINALKIV